LWEEDRIMKEKNHGKPGQAADDDFGLTDKVQDYHRHGGPQGGDHAKTLEGEIATTHVQHDHHLKKARPDSSTAEQD
jgi:hypothetical protein